MDQELLEYFTRMARVHKALTDAMPDLQNLVNLQNQVKELTNTKDALQKAIDDRTASLKDIEVQSTVQKEKLASEALKASEEADEIISVAEAQAEQIVNKALDKQIEIMNSLEKNRKSFMDQIDAAKNDLVKLQEAVADKQSQYDYWVKQIAELKAKLG